MTLLESFLEDLARLVNMDCGSENYAGVTRAAEIMQGLFETLGFKAQLVDLGPQAGKGLFATNRPDAAEYDLMLNAHLDTVFPDGTAAKRPLTVRGDRGYGPGCVDCKAGVLSIFYSLKQTPKEVLARLAIAVVLNPDEETGSKNSSKWLSEIAAKSKRACVFEPARPGGEMVKSRKGVATLKVVFHGKSSHAGNAPYKGANANLAAMRFALAASGLADVDKGITVNPGVIRGGVASNIISDNCEVILEMRYWTNTDRDLIVREMEELAKVRWAPGVTQEFVWVNNGPAMPYSEKSEEFVKLLKQAAELENLEVTLVDAGGASDANCMAERGIPVLDGCGPAGGELHSEREYLSLPTVEQKIRLMSRLYSLI